MDMAIPSTQGIRLIAIFLLVLGILWGLTLLAAVVVFGGLLVHVPPFSVYFMSKLVSMFAGPLLLAGGAANVLSRRQPKRGSISALIGCVIMTGFLAYECVVVFHELHNPALLSPPWATYTVVAVMVLLADIGAVRIYQSNV